MNYVSSNCPDLWRCINLLIAPTVSRVIFLKKNANFMSKDGTEKCDPEAPALFTDAGKKRLEFKKGLVFRCSNSSRLLQDSVPARL